MKTQAYALGADAVAGMAIAGINEWNEIIVTLIIVLGRIAIQWIIAKYNNKKNDKDSLGSGGLLSV